MEQCGGREKDAIKKVPMMAYYMFEKKFSNPVGNASTEGFYEVVVVDVLRFRPFTLPERGRRLGLVGVCGAYSEEASRTYVDYLREVDALASERAGRTRGVKRKK